MEQVIGDVIGYRSWKMLEVGAHSVVLYSLYTSGYKWTPGINEAYCRRVKLFPEGFPDHGNAVPRTHCECGFFSYRDPYYKHNCHLFGDVQPIIVGAVRVSGATILCETGFRSQCAEIMALSIPRRWDNCMACLKAEEMSCQGLSAAGEQYQVPVYRNYDEMIESFPQTHYNEIKGPFNEPPIPGQLYSHNGYRAPQDFVFDTEKDEWIAQRYGSSRSYSYSKGGVIRKNGGV